MTDKEKAIGFLVETKLGCKKLRDKELSDVCDISIKALEKQIPKKPLDITSPVVRWGLCPICKGEPFALGRPNRIFDSCNYCSNCGQALDWSGEND